MVFLGKDNIDLLLEVCEDMKISRDTLTNYAKIFYDNIQDVSSQNIMDLNKSFLLHMSHQSSTIGIYDKKEEETIAPIVQYTNEFALKIPPQPTFLDNPDTNTEELEVLIQQKLKERDNELFEIQKKYNPEDKIESVKLIKISDVLADLNVFSDQDDIPSINVNENNKQKVSIGDTVVYNYNNYDPPEQLKVDKHNSEEIIIALKSIIDHMNITDKKLDDLNTSIQSFINT
jgi:hypothetical protein